MTGTSTCKYCIIFQLHKITHVIAVVTCCYWWGPTNDNSARNIGRVKDDIKVTINIRCLDSIAVWNESTKVLIQYKPNKNLMCFIYFHLFRTYIKCFIFNQLLKVLFAPQSITIRKFCRVSLNQYNVIHLSICIKVQHIPSMTVPVHFVFI